jgi:hypothetical protein
MFFSPCFLDPSRFNAQIIYYFVFEFCLLKKKKKIVKKLGGKKLVGVMPFFCFFEPRSNNRTSTFLAD